MKILLSCLSFENFTGSEIYFYELCTALKEMGHKVSIFSIKKGSPLFDKIDNVSFVNKYTLYFKRFDLVLFSHGLYTWKYIKKVKTKKFVNIIHSEVINEEKPIISSKIDYYIGIRPSIINFIKDSIQNVPIKLIYNPFDFKRFNKNNCIKSDMKNKVILFLGSIDYLRVKPLNYLIELSEQEKLKIIHVGRNDYNIKHKNFVSYKPIWEVEKYYKKCDISSGIFLGRTSIEGLLCGKKVLQFDVSQTGDIKKVYWHKEENLDKFDKYNVAEKFIKLL